MAIVTAISEKTQSKSAMSRVMKYVAQDKKTLYENEDHKYKLLSGQNCCGETAFAEFMATKKQYAKEKGVYFYQYVQSFKPDERILPNKIHQMGVELAKYFEGFEVLIATHIDRDHYHNHLIVNSVSCENGKKLQFNEKNLTELRNLSDKICKVHDLEVLAPYEKSKMKGATAGEFRAAQRGESWKFRLMSAIDQAVINSHSKSEFIASMEQLGYKVKWEAAHKYITYTTPQGQKCRDNRLHETKYLKSEMESYYAKFRGIKENQFNRADAHTSLSTSDMRHTTGAMESNVETAIGNGKSATGIKSIHSQPTNNRRHPTDDAELLPIGLRQSNQLSAEENHRGKPTDNRYDEYQISEYDGDDDIKDCGDIERNGEHTTAQGYVGTEVKSQMAGAGALTSMMLFILLKLLKIW